MVNKIYYYTYYNLADGADNFRVLGQSPDVVLFRPKIVKARQFNLPRLPIFILS